MVRWLFSCLLIVSVVSCSVSEKTLPIGQDNDQIVSIEICEGSSSEAVEDELTADLWNELKASKEIGPTKFIKTHQILVKYQNGTIDTIYTNGKIHQFKGWYESDRNLIKTYKDLSSSNIKIDVIDEIRNLSIDSIGLFCYCFSDSTFKVCKTYVPVKPFDIIKENKRIAHLDENQSEMFMQEILVTATKIEEVQGINNRLILVLYTRNNEAKTLAYYSDSVLCYEDKYLLKINGDIKHMIRQHFNLSVIHCE